MKLEPCPFCGSSDSLTTGHIAFSRFAVECDNCGAHGPVFSYPDYSEEERTDEEWEKILTKKSINTWNRSGDQKAM